MRNGEFLDLPRGGMFVFVELSLYKRKWGGAMSEGYGFGMLHDLDYRK